LLRERQVAATGTGIATLSHKLTLARRWGIRLRQCSRVHPDGRGLL
jgi:hypothetical protein